jgi:hypothetical protein
MCGFVRWFSIDQGAFTMASNATSRWLETTLPSFRIASQISLQIAARKAVRFVVAILLVHASLLLAYAKA